MSLPFTLPPLPAHFAWAAGAVLLAALVAWRTRRMDAAGAAVGWGLALAIFVGAGAAGLLWLLLFFVLGTSASRYRLEQKEHLGMAEGRRGRRSVANALGNAGVAALGGLVTWVGGVEAMPGAALVAGSLAAATADTLASELGNVWGRRYVHVLTFRPDQRGRDGVVSLEGTLAGAVGAVCLAVAFGASYGWGGAGGVWLGGVVGNFVDSVLGATLQRRGYLDNHQVNFLGTAGGAAVAYVLVG